ncbi:MAG TPA: sigma-70 family RNA polymerase sigma factor [Ktedonobacterales bacterium]|nr:sigma-70 family RNA polymerase sigma factor [Ktedonobacterales bacterium]
MVDDLITTINAAQNGDLDAFGRIVVQFQDMACAVAYGWLGDLQAAEDCSQEAFIEAYLQLPSLREPAAFVAWLRTIIYKHCDRLTRRKQPPLLPLETAHGVAATDGDPAELSETRELQGMVQTAITCLPPPERAATRLYYLLGYSQVEIATQLGLPVATVKQRIAVARRRLRERLAIQLGPEVLRRRPSQAPRFARAVQFTIAVMCGDLPRVRDYLAEDRMLVQQREAWDPATARLYPFPVRSGFTPLHRAAVNGDVALASLLLAQGADPNARADLGQTPLHMAVLAGQAASVVCLLASGADPNLGAHHSMTPLHWAVCHERRDLAQLLLAAGARADLPDAGQRTPQDWARLKGVPLLEEAPGAQHVSNSHFV